MAQGSSQVFEVWAYDVDGDALIYSWTLDGTPIAGATGSSYNYTAETVGSHTLAVTMSDGNGGSVVQKWDITVTNSNHPPVAVGDTATTLQGVPVAINVLANDSDPDGDPLSVTSATVPAHGTATVNPDNSITYTPAVGYVGTDSFNYWISDGRGGVATAKVTVTVNPVEAIVDDKDASSQKRFCIVSGKWSTRTATSMTWDPSDPTATWRRTATTSGTTTARAEWSCTTLPAGKYEVFAWWPITGGGCTSTPYVIFHASGSTTVRVSQKTNGGKWVSLGTYDFAAGAHLVQINNGTTARAGKYVFADAARFAKR
jgi:hypothetical protein